MASRLKTPQSPAPELAAALRASVEIWLKREDLHPLGSHKGRSLPGMIAAHCQGGARQFVISSSGNAALAAARTVQSYNRARAASQISLTILTGPEINKQKAAQLKKIRNHHIKILSVARPKQRAFQMQKKGGVIWLRQSTDDTALFGYAELAAELAQIKNLAAVFIPTSSGTTAAGLWAGFKKISANRPQIHIVQTTACHPFVPGPAKKEKSLASAIVDTVGRRKKDIARVLAASGGQGYIATNEQISAAQKLVKKTSGLAISPNSALSVAGLTQAINQGARFSGAVVCLITGN